MSQKKKILITGADGQLAKAIISELKKQNVNYLALTKEKLDIIDSKKVNKTVENFKPDFIINGAAFNNVDGAEQNWQQAFLVNGIAVRNLVLASNKFKAILVHYSTDYVFDGQKKSPYTIVDRPNPINKYGESKYLGEQFVKHLSKKYYLIRLSWVFGENPEACFPLKLIQWAKKNKSLKIVDDQISSPSFVEDIARATLDLIESQQYGLYHMTNYGSCSKYEWAKYILKKLKWPGEIKPAKSKEFNNLAPRPEFSILDNFPLKYIIGYDLPDWQKATDKFLEKFQIKL